MVESETFVHVNHRLCRAIRNGPADKSLSRPPLFFNHERQHGIPAYDSSDTTAPRQQGPSYPLSQNSLSGANAEERAVASSSSIVQQQTTTRMEPDSPPTAVEASPAQPGAQRKLLRPGPTSFAEDTEVSPKPATPQRASVLARSSRRMSTLLVNEHPLQFLLLSSNPKRMERMHLPEWTGLLTAFRMQRNRRCLCPFSAYNGYTGAIWLLVQGLTLILIGCASLTLGGGYRPVTIEYKSSLGSSTTLGFTLEKSLKPPVYVYYAMSKFYGNFRTYQTSKPPEFWGGFSCAGFTTRERFDQVRPDGTLPEAEELEGEFVNPCGLSSWAYYNDIFTISSVDGSEEQLLRLDKSNIADWSSFILYSKDLDADDLFISTDSQSYRVWLPSMFTPTFKKLYAVIHEELTPGQYKIDMDVNLWPDAEWHSDKSIIVESHGLLGTGDVPIGITFISIGGIAILFACLVYLGKAMGFEYGGKSLSLVSQNRLEVRRPKPSLDVVNSPSENGSGVGPVNSFEHPRDDTQEQGAAPSAVPNVISKTKNSPPLNDTEGVGQSDGVTSANRQTMVNV